MVWVEPEGLPSLPMIETVGREAIVKVGLEPVEENCQCLLDSDEMGCRELQKLTYLCCWADVVSWKVRRFRCTHSRKRPAHEEFFFGGKGQTLTTIGTSVCVCKQQTHHA